VNPNFTQNPCACTRTSKDHRIYLGVRDFLARRRLTDLDFDALGVLERLVDLRREAFGVLERLLDRRRLGVRAFFGSAASTSDFGALGVLARRADRRRDALGVLELLLDRRRLGVRLFLATTSSPSALGALGVLALRRDADLLRLLLALGVLDLLLDRRRLGVLLFLATASFLSALGALGVLALRRDADLLRLLLALGVLERRLVLREAERLLEDLGVFDRFLERRRLGVLDFLGTSVSALGAFGVLARRREELRRLEAFGVLERRLVLREADRLLLDLGVLERLLARRRLGVFDFLASPSASGLGALGVLALRREVERREALGVLDLRFGVFDRFFDRRRLGVRDFLGSSVVFGAFGVLARRLTALRPFEALGVLDLRRRRRADRERLGAFGVLDRRELLRLDALGVRLRLAFLVGLEVSGLRARFLIPISLFLFSSISALY